MKHVDIIGAGVAGLSLGIALRQLGFSTSIFEKHSSAGGLCVNWTRQGYTFNGCMHWLLGARRGTSFYNYWKRLIDVDSMPFYMADERVVIQLPVSDVNGDNLFHYYTDIDKFESYLLNIAPEDRSAILKWTGMVRFVVCHLDQLPPFWPDGFLNKVSYAMRMMPLVKLLAFMKGWGRLTTSQFASQFKNPFLSSAVRHLYARPTPMSAVVFSQAYSSAKVAQYPIGGSASLTSALVSRYRELGGSLSLSTPVASIAVDDGVARGLVLADGRTTKADYVVSAADWHWTVFDALGGAFVSDAMKRLSSPSKDEVYYSYCRVFIGVAMPMTNYPHFARYMTDEFSLADGTVFDNLEVETYSNDPTLAPAGHTVMAVNMLTREGDWWIRLRNDDHEAYRKAKDDFRIQVVERLSRIYGKEWVDAIEVVDLVTPATFNRYTSNLFGSSQGWAPSSDLMSTHPARTELPGLRRFSLCGHWTVAGGGLPVAMLTAQQTAARIAKMLN
ncbi:MAG: NAD(P)/FAD-dependent oxidoreductase [Bacteroidales bacterium]|nr:NAD(P)/FAD-dependent oxidoreductase [Bacteroidales bacterium]